jgi:hypothetical protein
VIPSLSNIPLNTWTYSPRPTAVNQWQICSLWGHFKYLFLCGGTPKIIKILVVVPQISMPLPFWLFSFYFSASVIDPSIMLMITLGLIFHSIEQLF